MARNTIRGNAVVRYHSSAPATLAAISVATELGTNVTGVAEAEALMGMEGWESTPSTINVPDVLSLTTGNIPGETTFGTGTLMYYTDDTTNAVWDLLLEQVAGHLSIWPFDDQAADVYTIFSIEVISRTRALTTGNEAETHTISMSIGSRTEGTAVA